MRSHGVLPRLRAGGARGSRGGQFHSGQPLGPDRCQLEGPASCAWLRGAGHRDVCSAGALGQPGALAFGWPAADEWLVLPKCLGAGRSIGQLARHTPRGPGRSRALQGVVQTAFGHFWQGGFERRFLQKPPACPAALRQSLSSTCNLHLAHKRLKLTASADRTGAGRSGPLPGAVRAVPGSFRAARRRESCVQSPVRGVD